MRLASHLAGDGPVVVLHPSLGRPPSDFAALGQRLVAAGFATMAVEPRGVGGSELGSGDGLTLQDLAGDLLDTLDHAAVAQAHLVGHALGNRVVRGFSSDHPGRVRSLVLLAAGGRTEGDREARDALAACFNRRVSGPAHVASVRTAFFAPGNEVPASWRSGWHPEAAHLQAGAVRRTSAEQWWSGGQAPMLIVQGLQDRIAPPANGRALAQERPGTTRTEIDGAGHALLPEQPDAVADAVVGFLQDI